jgi:hypothetical protein
LTPLALGVARSPGGGTIASRSGAWPPRAPPRRHEHLAGMLYVLGIILLAAWIIGLAFKVTFAAFHLLLVLAIIAIIWAYMRGRGQRVAQ